MPRHLEGPRQAPSGWVFATRVEEEEATSADVTVGTILLHGVRCRALFDTGASHSFISKVFV